MGSDLIFLAFIAAAVLVGLVLHWIDRRREARRQIMRRLRDIGE